MFNILPSGTFPMHVNVIYLSSLQLRGCYEITIYMMGNREIRLFVNGNISSFNLTSRRFFIERNSGIKSIYMSHRRINLNTSPGSLKIEKMFD